MRLKTLMFAMALATLVFSAQADDRSWQDYLTQADRNGDGHLDRFEIMLVPPRQAIGLGISVTVTVCRNLGGSRSMI